MIVIGNGRRGPDVERWQRFLLKEQLLDGTADGIFGALTDKATRAFQRREGLAVDGRVGLETLLRAQTFGFMPLRRLAQAEVTPELAAFAKQILREHRMDAFGTEVPLASAGKQYVARIEQHYHAPGGPIMPWGYHPGVSLLGFVTLGPQDNVLNDPSDGD